MVTNLTLSRSSLLLLDTNAIIYFLTGREPYMAHLVALFRRVQAGQATVVISAVTEAELLVKPHRETNVEAVEQIADLLSEDGIRVLTVDRKIARRSAALRARHGFEPGDAIIVATAIESGCDAVVGNDKKWRRLEEITYVHLDEIAQQ